MDVNKRDIDWKTKLIDIFKLRDQFTIL